MKKDIEQREVSGVAIAIVPDQQQDELWDCYLINENQATLHNVFISSRGYGERDGQAVKTSTLRRFYDEIGPDQAIKIEPIQRALFDLAHEFWVSYRLADHTYDKKFVFVSGAVDKLNYSRIAMLDKLGVLHR